VAEGIRPIYRPIPDLLQPAFDVVRESVAKGELPSAVLAVADGREMLRCEAFGPADGSYSVRKDSLYLIASITKPIFAAAMMRLVERGKIRLNDPVGLYIPEFATNHKEGVTLWHLLTHTSGLDEGFAAELWERQAAASDYLTGACRSFLSFPPGTSYAYCNTSFIIMGELIRRIAGVPYPDFLRAEVTEPLGMEDTGFVLNEAQRGRAAPVLSGQDFDADYFVSLAHPAGGLYSTARDLVAFGQAFMAGRHSSGYRLLGPAAIAAMTRLHTAGLRDVGENPPLNAYYGLGWSKTGTNRSSGPSAELTTPSGFGHGGATGTYLWIEPDYGLVFVLLTNRWGIENKSVRDRALNAALGAVE
jgi:CubicO group peptidase (beta-lactamase class C family)